MKNPLMKRIPRELKGEFGKYVVIFLFMILVIGFISGFLVAAGSMIKAYDEGFEKYNVEYGHFISKSMPGSSAISGIKKDGDVDIDEQFYVQPECTGISESDGKNISSLRLFKKRENINLECLMEGEFPTADDEVAIDRMYADNNGFNVGDIISVGKNKLKISGLVALPDYSALFENNTDMMFDAVRFGVGIVTGECFDIYESDGEKVTYEYVWDYHTEPADDDEQLDMSTDFMKTVAGYISLEDYLPRYINQAINFTGEDFGGDSQMMKVILYVLIVVLAFVFSITIRHTIVSEASVIGTLRASGYTKSEITRHYLALPVMVTFISAIIGNVLGYTVFKDIGAYMYYNSYSLPTFVVVWNAEAFVLTTVIPVIIMFIINYISVRRALRLSPLRFIRHDLTKRKRSKAVRLPRWGFFSRFRLRIILQNTGNYMTMFIGIMLSNVFLLFGLMMSPLLTHYQDQVLDTMPAKYQYILKTQIGTDNPKAEKFCLSSLEYYPDGVKDGTEEEFSIYGIESESEYIHFDIPDDGTVLISDGIMQKYGIKAGDDIELHEPYEHKSYTFKVGNVVDYPGALALFMPRSVFNDTLKPEMGIEDVLGDTQMLFDRLSSPPDYEYYNAYFSDTELTDIGDNYVMTKITETELTKVSRQLDVSMGELFQLWNIFAIVLFALLIYLLTKLVLERNTNAISMIKILGYKDLEAARLYLVATTWVVILSILISFVIATPLMTYLYHYFMQKMSGWLTLWIGWDTYVKMFVLGVCAYLLIALLQYIKIRKIPMDEALKHVE